MTVRWRLTLVATIVFGVAFAAAAWGLVTVVHDNLVSGIKETNEQELALLANQLQQGTPVDDLRPQYVDVCVQRPNGQCEYVGTGVAVPRNPPAGYRQDQRVVETEGGRVTLVAQRSLAEVDSAVSNLKTVMWFAVPALIALVGAAVWFLAGRALRPVEVIRSEAEAITGSTLDRRVPEPRAKDEVGRLARTMNAMLDRLETSSQKQRQFVSDASHELRSPIASIRTNLEVALRHQDQADWPAIAERALADDERLETMVSDLLDLARLDEYEEPAPLESLPDVDLDELILEEKLRLHRSVIDTTQVSAGRVHGRREQLARVARNLIDNADRHATSRVDVALQTHADTVTLTVDDDGRGIAVDDRAKVFERFTRLDDGRARDEGGLGLGLSMVKAIVEGHGGTVEIDDAPIGGARFTVTLPAA